MIEIDENEYSMNALSAEKRREYRAWFDTNPESTQEEQEDERIRLAESVMGWANEVYLKYALVDLALATEYALEIWHEATAIDRIEASMVNRLEDDLEDLLQNLISERKMWNE